MSGLELARQLHALRADLPIILTSGNTRDLDLEAARAAGIGGLLEKPFTLEILAGALGRILRREPEAR